MNEILNDRLDLSVNTLLKSREEVEQLIQQMDCRKFAPRNH